jgi:hypothetical protein
MVIDPGLRRLSLARKATMHLQESEATLLLKADDEANFLKRPSGGN